MDDTYYPSIEDPETGEEVKSTRLARWAARLLLSGCVARLWVTDGVEGAHRFFLDVHNVVALWQHRWRKRRAASRSS